MSWNSDNVKELGPTSITILLDLLSIEENALLSSKYNSIGGKLLLM